MLTDKTASAIRIAFNCLAVFLATIAVVWGCNTWRQKLAEKEAALQAQHQAAWEQVMQHEAAHRWLLSQKREVVQRYVLAWDTNVMGSGLKGWRLIPGTDPDAPVMSYALGLALDVIPQVESGGNSNAVGDTHLVHAAYGAYQIRQPYLDDVNRIAGTNRMRTVWAVDSLSIKDMLDEQKAYWAATVYLDHYGEKYRQQTGHEPTVEVYARIHNGGPDGWRETVTNDYVAKVLRVIGEQ